MVSQTYFSGHYLRNASGHPKPAGDVACEAVSWVEGPHAPQQQSGLIVRLTVDLQRNPKHKDYTQDEGRARELN